MKRLLPKALDFFATLIRLKAKKSSERENRRVGSVTMKQIGFYTIDQHLWEGLKHDSRYLDEWSGDPGTASRLAGWIGRIFEPNAAAGGDTLEIADQNDDLVAVTSWLKW